MFRDIREGVLCASPFITGEPMDIPRNVEGSYPLWRSTGKLGTLAPWRVC
jgi:hypothetical protein